MFALGGVYSEQRDEVWCHFPSLIQLPALAAPKEIIMRVYKQGFLGLLTSFRVLLIISYPRMEGRNLKIPIPFRRHG
jgi:hypothetical protein